MCQKLKKVIFKLIHGKSCQYVILRTTQSVTSHTFKGFKQYIKYRTAFQLPSIKLTTTSQKCGLGGNRNTHSQIQPNYNCFAIQHTSPQQNSGSAGTKKFRMTWVMAQKQTSHNTFLAKCNFRKIGCMAPILPPLSSRER